MSPSFEALRDLLDDAQALALSFGQDNLLGDTLWQALLAYDDPAVQIIPTEDRIAVLALAAQEVPRKEPVKDTGQVLPLGIDTNAILAHAAKISGQTGSEMVEPLDLFLSLFSARFPTGEWLKSRGWVFETYRQAVQAAGLLPPGTLIREPVRLAIKIPSVPSRFTRWIIGPMRATKNVSDALGLTLQAVHLGDYNSAVTAATAAFQMMPDEPGCWLWLAEALVRAHLFEEALPYLARYREAFPDDADAGFFQSFSLLRLGRLEEALAIDFALLAQHPEDAEVFNNVGFGLAAVGRHTEAIEMYDKSLHLNPDYDFAFNNRGYSLHQLGRTVEGEALIYHSLSINRGNAYAFRNLAFIAASRGDNVAARSLAQRAFDFYYREDFGEDLDLLSGAEALP